MSNFLCDICGAVHADTRRGYVTGCACFLNLTFDEYDRQRDWPRCDVCRRWMVGYDSNNTNAVRCPKHAEHEE